MTQADGEYIPKQTVLENIDQWYEDKADIEDLIVKITYMQGVAIPNKTGHWISHYDDAKYHDEHGEVVVDKAVWEDAKKALEQEPKTGHWIADVDKWGDVVTTVNGYRCDKCNAFNSDKDNYCPNCGCHMVEPQERSDKE